MAKLLISNRFEINDLEKDLLGRGGMGVVYRAIDNQTGETVAVKTLIQETLAHEPDGIERFKREGEALRQLDHPHIVKFITTVETGGQHYLVMEYVDGGSLQELLVAQGHLSNQRTVELGIDLADALACAHRLGIIYRDLKPANVLLTKDGSPRLTDFGIAQLADGLRLTQTGILVGTVNYSSPEALSSEVLDTRTDIWAFGVLIFEMLTGKLPFSGPNLTARITAILTQAVPDLTVYQRDIPDALADLVYRMLEKDRQQRIPNMHLVRAALEAILNNREIAAPTQEQTANPASTPDKRSFPVTQFARISAPVNNLPIQPTPFVGRRAELTELARLLGEADTRLVTILGMGGMGKTRLALEVGAAELDDGNGTRYFEQGVCFVPLAPLQNVTEIIPAVATALGFSFPPGGEPRQQLLDYLTAKRLLLILDNFEHLLEGVELVTAMLEAAPHLKIVVTSRARLNVQSEQLFRLNGMDFPTWETLEDALEYSAVKLFLQGARRVRSGYKLVANDLANIARICRQVEGLPLGILLAAAWIDMLTPLEIATEISQNIDFLETEQRDLPERQRGMRGVFNHSWNLLNEREREVFCALSVFRGGFTRQVAQEIVPATLRELMSLMDRSLLQRAPTGRYEVHELLRQLAVEQLSNSGREFDVRKRHLQFFTSWAETAEPKLHGPQQAEWLDQLDVELANFRTALEWALAQDAQTGLRLASALWWFWIMRYEKEGANWLSGFVQAQGNAAPDLDYGRALSRLAAVADEDGDSSKAWAEQGLQISREVQDRFGEGFALHTIGRIAYQHFLDFITGAEYLEKSLAIFEAIGDTWGMARTYFHLGNMAIYQGRPTSELRSYQERSLALARKIGDWRSIALTEASLAGLIADCDCDLRSAHKLGEDAIEIMLRIKVPGSIYFPITQFAYILANQGELQEARRWLDMGMDIACQLGSESMLQNMNWEIGSLAMLAGQNAVAEQLIAKSQNHFKKPGQSDLVSGSRDAALACVVARQGDPAKARKILNEIPAPAEYPDGSSSMLLSSGVVSLLSQESGQALHDYRKGLELLWKDNLRLPAIQALEGLTWALHANAQDAQAAQLLGAAAAFRETIGAPVFPGDRPYYEQVLAELKAILGEAAFAKAWAAGAALDFDRAVEGVLKQTD